MDDQSQEFNIDWDLHGKDGRLWVMPTGSISNINKVYTEAFKEIGYTCGDYNGNMQDDEVIFRAQVTQQWGLRADSYSCYILNSKLENSTKIKTATFSQVRKLLYQDGSDALVSGVEVDRFGHILHLKARKEVILSAGSIGTPKVLMLSGLGPKPHLKALNILNGRVPFKE